MRFISTAIFGLSTLSTLTIAAPVADGKLVARGGGGEICCPKGYTKDCKPCSGSPPSDGGDQYSECIFQQQIALVNLYVCNVLNNNTVSVPITVSIPIDLGGILP